MRGGIRVARIFGINIRIDWSWLLIALLITWNLSAVFASAHPAWGTVLTWGIAVIAALLFFGSVLV
ncbi:MAG: peptidase M50, partial [Anaerolineae bacterium]